jgi:ADP-ribose pyrophosphatase YjhB (NUDIX family)
MGKVAMSKPANTEKAFLKAYVPNDHDLVMFSVDPVILTVIEGRLQVLLIRRQQYPFMDRWSLPGGRLDKLKTKTLEENVTLKLREKTGLTQAYFEQVGTEGGSDMDPRGWSVTTVYMALVRPDIHDSAAPHRDTVQWHPVDELDALEPLAFWHRRLIDRAVQRLRDKVVYTDLPIAIAGETFTLRDLRGIYEAILGRPLVRQSFEKRFKETHLLEALEPAAGRTGRPSTLYRYSGSGTPHLFVRVLEG